MPEPNSNPEMTKASSETISDPSYAVLAIVAAIFGGALLLLIFSLFKRKTDEKVENLSTADPAVQKDANGKGQKKLDGPSNVAESSQESHRRNQAGQNAKIKVKDAFTHPLLVATLRGHLDKIYDGDFSSNAKYLVTAAEDRSFHIWTCANFLTDDPAKEIRHNRLNLEFDYATLVRFSPDSKALLGRMYNENIVRVLKLNKKPDGNFSSLQTALQLPPTEHGDINFLDIECNGKYIMTGYSSTHICLWSLKGHSLATLASNAATLYCCKVSLCGRFVGASGFTPDVKVWEVNFKKGTGDYESVDRAFELKGHSAGVPAFAWSGDSTHMVSLSKDKTFRLYDINVEYKKKQDPRLIQTAKWTTDDVDVTGTQLVLSNDSKCVIIGSKMDVFIFSGVDGSLKYTIKNPVQGPIQKLMLDPSSGFIILIGGKIIRVFRNTVGFEITIATLEDKLKYTTQASITQRLTQQLEDTQKLLAACKYQAHQ